MMKEEIFTPITILSTKNYINSCRVTKEKIVIIRMLIILFNLPILKINKIMDNNNPDNLTDRRICKFYYSISIFILIP